MKNREVRLESELLFNRVPQSPPLKRQTNYSNWDRKPFESDSWIFAGTQNDYEDITSDLFDSMDVHLSDKEYGRRIAARLAKAYPLHFGDISNQNIDKKFRGRQLQRQIYDDCKFSNGSVRILQPTQSGTVSIPSQYRIENIQTFAGVSLKQAAVLSRIYCELGLKFKEVIKVNKAIKRRNVKAPWDIPINKQGLTLLECAKALKKVRTADQESPDWTEYDDGVFQFNIIDDLAAHEINELDLSEEVDPLANKPQEFTYWNQSTIKLSDSPKGKKTYRHFVKAITAVWNKTVKNQNLNKLQKYAKRFTKSQRRELTNAIHQRYAA